MAAALLFGLVRFPLNPVHLGTPERGSDGQIRRSVWRTPREGRNRGVTLQLVWVEYCAAVKAGDGAKRPYQYSQFCELYRRYEAKVDVVMRQSHRAGERLFIDYSGKRPVVWNRETGEAEEVELYVAPSACGP